MAIQEEVVVAIQEEVEVVAIQEAAVDMEVVDKVRNFNLQTIFSLL